MMMVAPKPGDEVAPLHACGDFDAQTGLSVTIPAGTKGIVRGEEEYAGRLVCRVDLHGSPGQDSLTADYGNFWSIWERVETARAAAACSCPLSALLSSGCPRLRGGTECHR